MSLKDSESYCIFDLDLKHKKPYLGKNAYSRSNVLVIEEDDGQMEARYQFQKIIGASDDKFKNIDKYYVKPKEYKEMMALLEREHVLVITGDAGIGKTYTAIHFLLEYYKKGYKPTWFYGMAKEDRDAQRTSLLNLEPQEKDVVYVEDPFGRTVFENRDELKTLFANLVERFKSSKSKLIITSREEVFKKFEQEILSGGSLEAYKQELNVRKPSYRKEDLKEIAKHYIKAYTNWSDNPKLVSIVNQGIEEQRLISPLMIYNLVKNHPTPVEDSLLQKAIINVRSTDLVTQFADEIRSLSHPAKILLYMVLLYGRRNIAVIRSMFPTVQLALLEKTKFEGSSFMFELKGQENHRIQRLGERIPVYRFSHPSYEEALIELSEKDSTCALINETCLSEIISYDSSVAAEVFSRFVIRYPSFLEGLIVSVISLDFESLKESTKLDLTRKMLASENRTFVEMAKRMYPVQRLVESIYVEDDLKYFELRIRSLSRRRGELANAKIAWNKVFTKDRISRLHPIIFIECYEIAGSLDDKVMEKIESNLQKADIIRKFILLPNDELRNRFELILSGTSYKGIYQDLKDKIPKDILDARHNKRKYAGVLKKYILLNSKPKGIVYLDKGAMKAVCRGAKLYPVGVVGVAGSFGNGDIIELMQEGKSKPILVMSELSSDVIDRYKGLRSSEIYELEDKLVPTTISRPYLWRYAGN